MMKKMLMLVVVVFIIACSKTTLVQAKTLAPVDVQFSVPDNMHIGEQVNMKIRFVATVDLSQLTVYAKAYSGITLNAGGDEEILTDVKSGSSHEIETSIVLNQERGSLAVYVTTTEPSGRILYRNFLVPYVTAKDASQQKMSGVNAKGVTTSNTGEKQILVPAIVN